MLRLALDTGATGTLVNAAMLVAIGYDPALAPESMPRADIANDIDRAVGLMAGVTVLSVRVS